MGLTTRWSGRQLRALNAKKYTKILLQLSNSLSLSSSSKWKIRSGNKLSDSFSSSCSGNWKVHSENLAHSLLPNSRKSYSRNGPILSFPTRGFGKKRWRGICSDQNYDHLRDCDTWQVSRIMRSQTLSLIQQISPNHLTARAITTTRYVRAMDADLDLNFRQLAWLRQSRTTKTSYDWDVTCSYNRDVTCSYDSGQIRRRKSWRSWLSSVSLSYKSRYLARDQTTESWELLIISLI